jgi:DNA repair exonuclease SbcCD ATPase subunit
LGQALCLSSEISGHQCIILETIEKGGKIMAPDEDNITLNTLEESLLTPNSEAVHTMEVVQTTHRLQTAAEGHVPPPEGIDRGNLEKVRDILFGSQIRKQETQFTQLEKHLSTEYMHLREDVNRRFDKLEAYIQTEIEALAEQLKETKASQSTALEKLAEAHYTTTTDLGKSIDQLNQKMIESERSLRKQLLDQSQSFSNEMRQNYDALLTSLDREVQGLHRASDTDRAKLSAFFGELSLRLQADK